MGPHKALGNIILDDITEPPVATKEKKSKKKLKDVEKSPELGKKPKKKKKKSSKKTEIPSSDDEEVGPNMFVSRNIDLPEGASISDLDRSDTDDGDDPYKALG